MTIDFTKYKDIPAEALEQMKKDLDGYESPGDVAGLRKNRDELLTEKNAATEAAKEATKLAEQATIEKATAAGDVVTLTKSYEEKFAALQGKHDALEGTVATQKSETGKKAVDAEVNRLAAEIAGDNAALLAPHIRARLRADDDGSIKVTDDAGGLTVSTLDELTLQLRSDKRFASVVVASKATGGGALGTTGGGAVGNLSGSLTEKAQALGQKIPTFANLPLN